MDKYFSPSTKTRLQQMVTNVKASFRDHLSSLNWMGEQTRKEALAKLDKITAKIGYPDNWRDYSALHIDRAPYVTNGLRASGFSVPKGDRQNRQARRSFRVVHDTADGQRLLQLHCSTRSSSRQVVCSRRFLTLKRTMLSITERLARLSATN